MGRAGQGSCPSTMGPRSLLASGCHPFAGVLGVPGRALCSGLPGGENRSLHPSPLIPMPPSPFSSSHLAEEPPKENQAALPPLEVASPKAARKPIMKHTMLIPSCISQLGTFSRAAPRGLAPHPLPFPPASCPHPHPRAGHPASSAAAGGRAPLSLALLSPLE